MSDAYLLISHGSRDPRPQIAIDRLAQQLRSSLAAAIPNEPPILVATAQLELALEPLHVQISGFAHQCASKGYDRVVILPLFLSPGVHAIEDIPAEVALAEREIGHKVRLKIAPFLGNAPNLGDLFARNRSALPSQSIILAHGSRRTGGNAIVERLADSLTVKAAYWSVSPSLTDRVAEAIAAGATEIGILPYFLFAGGITDAICDSVAQLQQQHPQVKLILGEPIGDNPALIATIGKILTAIDK